MAARTLAERFEAKVDRSGEHHLWTGSTKADGTGKLKINGKTVTAPRAAWQLAHGPLPEGVDVMACEVRACVRVEHLKTRGGTTAGRGAGRRVRGGGTKVEIRPGVWKLTVSAGRYENGRARREHRTVHAQGEDASNRALAEFAAEVHSAPLPKSEADRDILVDDAVAQFLDYLENEKGRAAATIVDYRNVHSKWGSPRIGQKRVRDVGDEHMDDIFGAMHRAGLSASRMNSARNLYGPFFRWARRRRIVQRSPMAEFEMPTSSYVPEERQPPEVEELCLYLATAVEVAPDVAPVLSLGAVTGARRGELVAVRRSLLFPKKKLLRIEEAVGDHGLKATKTRTKRDVGLDDETLAMLVRHCERMDERAAEFGVEVAPDGFVFSLEPDCARPMSPQYVTRQVAKIKDHLGIAVKRPETIALEDEALRLFRQPPEERRAGKPGPKPKGGMSFQDIGRRLRRTGRWAKLAVDSALRREEAATRPPVDFFDGSIIALRKFTSSELLDAGFKNKIRPRAWRARRAGRLVVGLMVVSGCLFLVACGSEEASAPPPTTTAPDAERTDAPATPDDPGVSTTVADDFDVPLSDPLSEPSANFDLADNGSVGRLEFIDGAYRIAIVGRPFLSPLQDRGLANLTSAEMSVEVTMVSGLGTAGFTCGMRGDGSAYMLAISRNTFGETAVAIAYYRMPDGLPVSVFEGRPDEGVQRLELPPLGESVTVGVTCEPGDGADEARLAMTLDGEEVVSVTGNRGRPEGQVGLFAWGQGPEQLVADFRNFTVSGSLTSTT
jgi:site-specific recombinase XerD